MTPTPENIHPEPSRNNQRVADILTLICMGTTGVLVLFAVFGPQEGMEALGIIVPWFFAGAAHFLLSLPALLFAWKSKRHWRNVWIFGYFLIFWGFHTVYFVQMSELDAAFMRQVHTFKRPVDSELYHLLTTRTLRNRTSPPLDLAVKVRILALIEQGADVYYRPPGSRYNRGPLVIAAARSGEPELVAAMLDRGVGVDGSLSGSQTPLMAATRLGHHAVVELLIKRGADPGNPRYRPASPLIEAVRKKDHRTAAILIKSGAAADYHPPDSAPPLFYAAGSGDAPMMKLLLDAGANPNQLFFDRRTSAMIGAVESGCVACVRHLLNAGGYPVGTNRRGESVMTIAVEKGLADIMALLRETAAKRPAAAGFEGTFDDLFNAVKKKHWDLLAVLLELGVNPNLVDRNQKTVLVRIASRQVWRSADPLSEIKAAEMLTAAGADPDTADKHGYTPLNHACRVGALDLVRFFLGKGANVNLASTDGRTPLLNALWKAHGEIAADLLAAGADPNARTPWGANSDYPLRIAAGKGDVATVRRLLESGAVIRPDSRDACDLFRRAAKHPEIVAALAGSGVDLNRKDPLNRYSLAVVMRGGSPESVRVLLLAGARPLFDGWRGHQPIDWFAETGQVDLLHVSLEQYPDLRADRQLLKNTLYRAIRNGRVGVVQELLTHDTFYTRLSEVEAILKWTKPPPEHPRAKSEIRALFRERLAAERPPREKTPTSPVLIVVPGNKP